jgi:crotonobetainyl-CoA:carnitine CoA-transferase CaiB-like acyl-CoA transferase
VAHPDLIFDRVQRIGDLPTDPAVIANDYLTNVPHPRYGNVSMLRHPVNLSATPASVRRVAPDLGQHTTEVLKERLGKTDDEIADLVVTGAIA